jgi:hypothetical protein
MKIVTYKCNLCGEIKQKNDLQEMYFRSAPLPQTFVLQNVSDNCDRHICYKCIEVVENYIDSQKTK